MSEKVIRDKLAEFYGHMHVTSDLYLVNLDQFNVTTNNRKVTAFLECYFGDKWVPLNSEFSYTKKIKR